MINDQILYELRIDLTESYRKYYKDEKPFINWTDALCNEFAKHISENIKSKFTDEALFRQDNKVSETTIQRIFNRQFVLKEEMHWTTRRILNNLAVYLGHDSWNIYAEIKTKKIVYLENGKISRGEEVNDNDQSRFTFCLEVVQHAKQAEFDFYKGLPTLNYEILENSYVRLEDEYLRIVEYGKLLKEKGYTLERQSRFSILSAIYVELNTDGHRAIVTNEYWYLEFSSKEEGVGNHYFSLRTFQIIHLTDEWQILNISYSPLCPRDVEYVKQVYGLRSRIDIGEVFTALPSVDA